MIRSITRFGLGTIVALTAAVLPLTARAVTYTAADTFDLNNTTLLGSNSFSVGYGAFGSQQVGFGMGGNTGFNHALLWSGTAASAVDLNPAGLLGSNSSSVANGIFGNQQIGYGFGDNTGGIANTHALLWTGYNTSAVDLNPAGLLGSNSSSFAYGTSGSQQVGYGYGGNTGNLHALLWTGTAANAVDLNPASLLGTNSTSQSVAISGSQQVGYGSGGNIGGSGFDHALMWTGTAVSAVDLDPAALLGTSSYSRALATSGSQQVGYGSGANTVNFHALLWSGTAASAIDLNPVLLGSNSQSFATATSGSQQVGYGSGGNTGGNDHALLWAGTAASAVDLHALLPAGSSISQASGIDPYGNIVGSASIGGATHAVEWLAGDLYTGAGGNWNNNWTSGTPTTGNDVLLIQTDSINRLVAYPNVSPAVTLGQFTIDATGTGTMTLSQVTNTLTSTSEIIGFLGAGELDQTGGTHTVIGTMTLAAQAGSQGTYNLGTYDPSGTAALHAGSILLNSGGTFNQIGGRLYAGTFTQAGGTVNGTLQNQGTFIYQSGQFNGRLLNQGTLNLGPSFTADNGVENDAAMTLIAGQTLTVNGAGLDNLGTLALSGGTISGAGPVLNDYGGLMSAYGTINPAFINDGLLTITGVLRLNGGASNNGIVQGNGSVLGGIANNAGGIINANGSTPLLFASLQGNDSGATIEVGAGSALNIINAWTNSGLVTLQGANARLAGGAVTNTGTIQGAGMVGSQVLNTTGVIRASGGELDLAGTGNTNASAAQIQAGTGGTVMVLQGLATNTGTIALSGGTFDNNNRPITNSVTGFLIGSGIFRSGGLTNNGTVRFADNPTSVYGSVTTAGAGSVVNLINNTTTFYAPVTIAADSSLVTVNATARFLAGSSGSVTSGLANNGAAAFAGSNAVYGTVVNTGAVTVGGGSSVVFNNQFSGAGSIVNSGTVVFDTSAIAPDTIGGALTNNPSASFVVNGDGTLEVDAAPTLANSSSIAVNNTTRLKLNVISGSAMIGTGVTATVSNGATLELAGSVSALSNGSSRVNITNNSSAAAGLLVSGKGQQVGNIDGLGNTQVNPGSDLTANHIIQIALVIGGTAANPGLVTIDASDASGNPLGQSSGFALASSLDPSGSFGAGSSSSANLSNSDGINPAALSLGNSGAGGNPSPVPEPSTLLLVLLAFSLLVGSRQLPRSGP